MTPPAAEGGAQMLVLSAAAALTAAALFGLSSVVMARVASAAPIGEMLHLRLLLRLLRSPAWLLGAGMQAVSFCVQALALAFGPLVLVQPLAATDLLFALPAQAWLSRRRLGRREWLGALLVVAGVAIFLTISPPRAGLVAPSAGGWIVVALSVGGFAVVAAATGARSAGTRRTVLLAAAGAATFALVDVVSKAAVDVLRRSDLGSLLATWYPYALLGLGVAGLLLSQSAFQAGALHISLPVIDTVEPTAAVVIGAVVFQESLAASPVRLAVQIGAGAVALAGIVTLDYRVPASPAGAAREP